MKKKIVCEMNNRFTYKKYSIDVSENILFYSYIIYSSSYLLPLPFYFV